MAFCRFDGLYEVYEVAGLGEYSVRNWDGSCSKIIGLQDHWRRCKSFNNIISISIKNIACCEFILYKRKLA